MTKDQIFEKIQDVIAARKDGDRERLKFLVAEGATYRVAAKDGSLPGFPVEDDDVGTAIDKLIELIDYGKVTYAIPIVDGLRATVVIKVEAKSKGVPHDLRLCGMWEFDADGRAISLTEYTDTAAMRDWLTRAAGAAAGVPLPQDNPETVAAP